MAVSSASARGWGNVGKPGSAAGVAYRKKNIVTITVAGISLSVHKGVAPLFKAAINECAAKGRRFDKVKDDWGYAHRYIRGSKTNMSNHSYGLAIDLDATRNPLTEDGKIHTDMPAWVVAVFAKYGFFWGGSYSGKRKDPMHFEFLGTPASAAALIKQLGLS